VAQINLTITAETPEELKAQIAGLAEIVSAAATVKKRIRRTPEQIAAEEAEAARTAITAVDPQNETQPSATAPLPPTQPATAPAATAPVIYPTLEVVRTALGAVAAAHGRDAAFALLAPFGVAKLGELPEAKRPELLAAIAKLG
jgi:hypothetical protein